MGYELISSADFDGLPEDPEEAFLAVEEVCTRNMNQMISEDTSREFDQTLRLQYMATVSAAATECNIVSIRELLSNRNTDASDYPTFALTVGGEVARLRLRNRRSIKSLSVQLSPNTRTIIRDQVERLKRVISASDIASERQAVLIAKLDELLSELEHQRASFGKTMAVLSALMVGMSGATTIASDGPAAITNIIHWIGKDKETEDAAKARLAPPPLAIPSPVPLRKTEPRQSPDWSKGGDLDDDIPF